MSVNLIVALEGRMGLAIFIYDTEKDIPQWATDFKKDMREGELYYYSPSARDFWDFLWERNKGQPLKNYYHWDSIRIDKRKPT